MIIIIYLTQGYVSYHIAYTYTFVTTIMNLTHISIYHHPLPNHFWLLRPTYIELGNSKKQILIIIILILHQYVFLLLILRCNGYFYSFKMNSLFSIFQIYWKPSKVEKAEQPLFSLYITGWQITGTTYQQTKDTVSSLLNLSTNSEPPFTTTLSYYCITAYLRIQCYYIIWTLPSTIVWCSGAEIWLFYSFQNIIHKQSLVGIRKYAISHHKKYPK